PNLATSWKVTSTSDRSTVVFNIRKGVTCSDGTPMTPSVIANFFKFMTTPGNELWYGPSLLSVAPFQISADDAAGTFTFSGGEANSDIVNNFTWPVYGIVCP